MKIMILTGRILFGLIFVASAPNLFKSGTIQQAAAHGLPEAQALVPAAGILALLGGLSVMLGCKARWGAWLLIVFLAPVTVVMHNFWAAADPAVAQQQQIDFMKNAALIGGALVIAFFGAGPWSVDSRAATRALGGRTENPSAAQAP